MCKTFKRIDFYERHKSHDLDNDHLGAELDDENVEIYLVSGTSNSHDGNLITTHGVENSDFPSFVMQSTFMYPEESVHSSEMNLDNSSITVNLISDLVYSGVLMPLNIVTVLNMEVKLVTMKVMTIMNIIMMITSFTQQPIIYLQPSMCFLEHN